VAGYIVRNGSYFSWYSEQSEHRERYARCGRGISQMMSVDTLKPYQLPLFQSSASATAVLCPGLHVHQQWLVL
jgi:hypothetical protein